MNTSRITSAQWFRYVGFLVLIVVLVVTLFPIIWIVLTSFKGGLEMFAIPPTIIIQNPTIDHYADLKGIHFFVAVRNSIIVGLFSTAIALVISAPAAYALARYRFPGSRTIPLLILMVRMVPRISLVIPFFRFIGALRLMNTLPSMIITYQTFQVPFAIWLLEGFFRALPKELEQAATLDGCSRFRAFLAVIIPVAATGLATVAIFSFIASANEFLYAVTFTRTWIAHTAPVAISANVTSWEIVWGRMAASATLYMLPVLAFNFFFQGHIVRGLVSGSIKE